MVPRAIEQRCDIEMTWIPLHAEPPLGWEYADHVPPGFPDPRDMKGHRLIMRERANHL